MHVCVFFGRLIAISACVLMVFAVLRVFVLTCTLFGFVVFYGVCCGGLDLHLWFSFLASFWLDVQVCVLVGWVGV